MNVLLHGDGGQSFLDFPNQAVQDNLMGVVIQGGFLDFTDYLLV
jgi:hypothetical protein